MAGMRAAVNRPLSWLHPLQPGQWKEHLKMAYNKTKHLSAAQKYLQQGKTPQAIVEYQQILKNEPKDQVTPDDPGRSVCAPGRYIPGLGIF